MQLYSPGEYTRVEHPFLFLSHKKIKLIKDSLPFSLASNLFKDNAIIRVHVIQKQCAFLYTKIIAYIMIYRTL